MQFLEVGPELGNSYSDVIAPQDVATYGGLCALASFDRTELKASILPLFPSLLLNLPVMSYGHLIDFLVIECFHFAEQSYRQYQLPEFLGVGT